MAVAAAGALVIVNTVVYVQAVFGLGQSEMALALAAFGGGSMLVALVLPRLLDSFPDRTAMLAGASTLAAGTLAAAAVPSYGWLLPLWFVLGAGYSLALTPSGRLLRRSSHAGGPAGALRRAVRAVACLLADHLSARGVGRSGTRPAGDLGHAGGRSPRPRLAAAAWLWPSGDPEVRRPFA